MGERERIWKAQEGGRGEEGLHLERLGKTSVESREWQKSGREKIC